MHKMHRVLFVLFVAVVSLTLVSVSSAYERYNDGCNNCHDFFSNTSLKPNNTWPDSKHNVHRHDMLDGVCDACHLTGDNRNPYLNQSNGTQHLPGLGCVGCHGRDYGPPIGTVAMGLRRHHANSGITICGMCHNDDTRIYLETVSSPYYGLPTVNINESCNSDGWENWTSDGLGLDNDGDLTYDLDDADCVGPPHYWEPVQR